MPGCQELVCNAWLSNSLPARPSAPSVLRHCSQWERARCRQRHDCPSPTCSEGIAGVPRSSKYAQMRGVLLGYRDAGDVHAIVFVRTRADARVLRSVVEADPQLSFLQAHLLMGHGSGSDGMDVAEQRAACKSFAAQGRHLLVATAAAEEGLNIPSCHCVIRFSAPQTGRERTQSRGLTRQAGSMYWELVEEGSLEERLAHKSDGLAGFNRNETCKFRRGLAGFEPKEASSPGGAGTAGGTAAAQGGAPLSPNPVMGRRRLTNQFWRRCRQCPSAATAHFVAVPRCVMPQNSLSHLAGEPAPPALECRSILTIPIFRRCTALHALVKVAASCCSPQC